MVAPRIRPATDPEALLLPTLSLLAALAPDPARATELHLTLSTPTGVNEHLTWSHTEMFRTRHGPVQNKKASVVYTVSVPSAVYDPLENAFRVELSTCLEWSRKGTSDRYCQRDAVLVPPEGEGPAFVDYVVKGKEKFVWKIRAWFVGEPPVAPGLPAPEPEPEPDDLDL